MADIFGYGFKLPPGGEKDPAMVKKLGELNEALRENPLLRYNNPELLPPEKIHRKQMEFHAVKCPSFGVKALIAANRSGKTVACVVDDIIQLVPEEFLPPHLKPFRKFAGPVTIWVGAPKNDTHFKNTIPLFRKFLPKGALIEGRFEKSFKSQPAPELKLVGGSTVAFKTYDQDLDAWASAEVHRIHWDEEPNTTKSRELRTEASMRLVSTEGDELIGMTPVLGFSWVHDDVWRVRHTDPLVSVMQMGMADNPWNTPDAIKKAEARCKTTDEFRMRIKGEFVHVGGSFFEEFSDRDHVVDPPKPEKVKDLDVVVGIDPGFRHTGITWTAFDKENSALVFAELDSTGAVAPTASEIRRVNREWGIEDPTYIIDPALVIAGSMSSESVQAAYAREEIYCQPGQKDRRTGILELKRRFGNRKPNGELAPTIFYSRDCPQLIRQTSDYRRNPNAADEWATIPQTDSVRFDLIDSLRYAVLSRAWDEPDPEEKHFSYQPNYQPPFSEELALMQADPAPYGDWS